jgi:serine/threonine protein kinase, bacterial
MLRLCGLGRQRPSVGTRKSPGGGVVALRGGVVALRGVTGGVIYVSADLGLDGPGGVAVDMAGSVYVADTHNDRVVKLPTE